jgi:formylglycine-generating enzyme required for sulfatase activity
MRISMAVSLQCDCGKLLKVASTLVGKKVKCPECKHIMLVESESVLESADARKASPARMKSKSTKEHAADGKPDLAEPLEAENSEQPTGKRRLYLILPLLLLAGGVTIFLVFSDVFLGFGDKVPARPDDDRSVVEEPKVIVPVDLNPKQVSTLPWKEKETVVPDKVLSDPNPLEKEIENSIGMFLVRIEPGKFMRGSPVTEKDREPCEDAFEAEITRSYYLGKFEVMQSQYNLIMGSNPSAFKGENLPVDSVSWDDAKEFCVKLSSKEGRLYTLPTEAEWEYGCRAGSKTVFSVGNTISAALANYNGNFAYAEGVQGKFRRKTVEVGSFVANAWGLHDMHGNVAEWCEDYYDKNYFNSRVRDPDGPVIGEFRCVRGGSWSSAPAACRSASRFSEKANVRSDTIGFRVVLRPRADARP